MKRSISIPTDTLWQAGFLLLPPLTAAWLMQFTYGVLPWAMLFPALLANALCIALLYWPLCGLTGRIAPCCIGIHIASGAWGAANCFVQSFRGTPILLQLYFFWIGLPKLVPFELTDTQCIVAALVVNASAFISEIIRAGIGAVDKGQWEAARSIGLSETHVMTRIILPQAVKNILPALCNEFISTVKGTSLASVFFVGELMTSFKTVQSATFLALQSLTIVGIIYFLLNFILSRLLRVIERRLTVSD